LLAYGGLRGAGESQIPSRQGLMGYILPERLHQAGQIMESSLEEFLTMRAIANEVGLSQRQLHRLFQEYTGISPVRFYLDRWLDRARGVVTQTDFSILEIAMAGGFSTPQCMTRCYRQRFP